MTAVDATGTSRPATSPHFLSRLLRRPIAVASLAWLMLVLVASAAAGAIAPYTATQPDLGNVLTGPSSAHLLGTDALGRDVLSRLLYGGLISLAGVAEAVVVFVLLGVTLGLMAGYLGGWVDSVVTRTVDVVQAVPAIILLLVVLAVFPANQTAAMIVLGILVSPSLIRVTRAATLSIREELYISAARVFGLSRTQILIRHVLPRTASTIIVNAAVFAGVALAVQSGLAFLGLGPQPPQPSWGGMVADASQVLGRDAWLLVPPGLVIGLTILAFGLLGDAIRDTATERWSTTKLAATRHRAAQEAATEPTDALQGPPDASAVLSVRHLSIQFGQGAEAVTIVHDVSFDVGPGETLGVVGESGCGKTMTAMGIMGLLPTGGRICGGTVLFNGEDLTRMTSAQLAHVRGSGIAYVSQEPMIALDPTFTVGSQIAEAVRRHQAASRAAARQRAVELLKLVKLPDPEAVARRYPYQLSGGMAQRAAIALALAGDPKLLIADEPTTALDVTVQAEILALLHELQSTTQMAVLLVTHDLGVVADLCERAVVMYAGEVVEQAAVDAMFSRPLHPYTEGLLASNPHAAVEHEKLPVEPGTPAPLLPTIPGTVPPPQEWPVGCHFQDRCPYVTDECRAAPVPQTEPAPGRLSRCIHTERVGAEVSVR